MKELLLDVSKFKEITVEPRPEIYLLLQHEGKLIEFLKRIKGYGTTAFSKYINPHGAQPGTMNRVSKIHKSLLTGFPKLRPILSVVNTGTHKWENFFFPFLKPFFSNNYVVKDSLDFTKDKYSTKLLIVYGFP